MPDAWMVRESEQQTFVESLHRKVDEAADEKDDYPGLPIQFAADVLTFIKSVHDRGTIDPAHFKWESGELLPACWKAIAAFSRVESERLYLLAKLLDQLTPAIRRVTDNPYRDDEIKNPQAVYGAESATAHINFES